jgi:hypothetical protein
MECQLPIPSAAPQKALLGSGRTGPIYRMRVARAVGSNLENKTAYHQHVLSIMSLCATKCETLDAAPSELNVQEVAVPAWLEDCDCICVWSGQWRESVSEGGRA